MESRDSAPEHQRHSTASAVVHRFPQPSPTESSDQPIPVSRIPAVNVATVPQRSPLRYPGGKTWLVPHIREWLGQTRPGILIEPFAGGGIVSLTAVMEGFVDQAVMMEIDRDVAAFWHAALRNGDALARRVMSFTPTLERLREMEQNVPPDVVGQGFRTLVMNRTKRAGILAPGATFNKYGENGKGVLSRWYPATLAARLNAIEQHASRISFFEGDGTRLLPPLLHGWGRRAAVFIDPPYTVLGGKRPGTRLYAHNELDHASLFALLAERRSNFLMTYDNAPEVVRLIRKHGFHAASVQMKNAHHNRLPELLITRERLFA